ncbi:hypothetical protein [Chlamydia psittaci]|uniref:hypothetical protein n=1 Tax=Chlamydia psittaci TaxID=83554 RepID=UPI00027E5487|nr:hypothetical protein [Chlamydia psittaci]EPJ24710.1 hypothetical protein CP09DC77_0987 [Chlamydia psittaci 09DC77]EPJ29655.1 hypothetical protein CP09DC78_0981 [Chlamydia psittaci 09DC78]EPL01217.1 hypothetical protein CP09DC79_0702 [Chlamydia psittaci 09DC79]AFS27004.1 hypothetical protein B711_0606 [Chlamydia psittaci CP3]EPJ26456.1 hypothetical protein CP09DC80_0985 [Chlamydia psittaci 09DC80]
MTISNNNTNDCYFSIDSTFEGDVAAGNVQTNDVTSQSIESTSSLVVNPPGTSTFSGTINVEGLTSANDLNITGNNVYINLNGNRLSNVARPIDQSSPVPANYIRSPEYFFCSLNEFGRININTQQPVPILGTDRLVYQSQNIFSHIRFVDYSYRDSKVTYPGSHWVQLLSKGIYMIDYGINKRWGWNNGWGGDVHLKNASGTIYSINTIYSGGGYSGFASLSTAFRVSNLAKDPNGTITNDPKDSIKENLFCAQLTSNEAVLSAFYFGIIFYPNQGE